MIFKIRVFAALHSQGVVDYKSIFNALIRWTFLIMSLKSVSCVLSRKIKYIYYRVNLKEPQVVIKI